MTRIVAGSAKGRTLAVPKSGTRPTSERVREALFSRLDHVNVLNGTVVLDLYAGTGALGLEALSRGSARATLVEKSSAAARVASANVRSTGLPARVVTADARSYLCARTGEDLRGDVDLVFIDPPYDIAEADMTTVLSLLGPWIGPDALVVVERSTRAPVAALPRPRRPAHVGRDHRLFRGPATAHGRLRGRRERSRGGRGLVDE